MAGGRSGFVPGGPTVRFLVAAAAVVVLVAGLRAAAPILIPVLLAVFLAFLGYPILEWLIRYRVRLSLAVTATVLLECGLLLVLGFLLSDAVGDFAKAAPGYVRQLVAKARAGIESLQARGVEIPEWLSLDFDPGSLAELVGGVVRGTFFGLASFLSYAVLVLVVLTCVLYEVRVLPKKLERAWSGSGDVSRYLEGVIDDVQRYLGVKTVVSAATGLLVGLWVWLLDMPFPLFWAAIAFLLNYIPAIGSILAAIPAVLVSLVQQGPGHAALVALGFMVVNLVLGNIIEPRLMGRRFGLSTLVVFLAMIFWGWVWGPVGMLLSIPLTMVVKIVLEQTAEYRWIAVLLGPGEPPQRPEPPPAV
jgi:predicted PurR-regulated permease PerM